MRRWIWIAIALVGCATPYQPKGLRGGYEDYEVERTPGVHFISFEGNLATDDDVVYRYWRQRVNEVCGGKEWQVVASGDRRRIVPIQSPRFVGYVRCGPPEPFKLEPTAPK
jgi:hypothetical protein